MLAVFCEDSACLFADACVPVFPTRFAFPCGNLMIFHASAHPLM
jgi:hypothetical protein